MFKVDQKVILELPSKPGQKKINENNKVKRDGIVKFISNKFITIWVRALKSDGGWNESFLIQDIGSLVLVQNTTAKKLKKIS